MQPLVVSMRKGLPACPGITTNWYRPADDAERVSGTAVPVSANAGRHIPRDAVRVNANHLRIASSLDALLRFDPAGGRCEKLVERCFVAGREFEKNKTRLGSGTPR